MGASCGKAGKDATMETMPPANPEGGRPSPRRSHGSRAAASPKRGSHSMQASATKGASMMAARGAGKQASTLTARASEDVEWSNSEHSFVSNTTATALYGTGNTVVRLTEDNLLRYERMYQYRSGQNNAIKKQLFQRLLEDSIRFSQMEPEPIPEEYLNARRERSSSRSDRSQKTSASGSASTTVVDERRDASPSGTRTSEPQQLLRTRSARTSRAHSPTASRRPGQKDRFRVLMEKALGDDAPRHVGTTVV